MAKQLAALLGGGLDLKALAEMLRRQGRGQDTILAHITPQEAALLKSRGGAGTMNPATGLPEFQEDPMNYGFGYEGEPYSQEVTSPNITSQDIYQPGNFPTDGEFGPSLPPVDMTGAIITETGAMPDYTQDMYPAIPPSFRPSMNYGDGITGAATETFDRGVQTQAAPQRDFASMLKAGAKEVLGTREGLAGLGTAAALLQARQAGRQARRMQQELSQIGAPQRALGQEMIARGQRGEITPVQQQQLAALQAQQRQQLASRGLTSGTAAQQQQARMVEMQQRGAQDLIDQGIKIAGIGDQYQAAAIRAGYAADQATRDMLNTTLTNLYRTIYGNVATPATTSTTATPGKP
jgi:hypothetical protein